MAQFVNFNFCRCCLNEEKGNQNFVDMKNEAIVFKNRQTSFYDCYFEISGCTQDEFLEIPVSQCKICPQCLVTLKTAHVFRLICQETSSYLRKQFAVTANAIKIEPTQQVQQLQPQQQVVLIAVNPQSVNPQEIKIEPEMNLGDPQQLLQAPMIHAPEPEPQPMEHEDQTIEQPSLMAGSTEQQQQPPPSEVQVVKAVFPCNLCPDTSFATKARLTTHMKKKHANKDTIASPTVTSEVSYKCQHCPDIFFGTEAELFEHLNRSHYNMSMAIPIQAVQTKTAPNRMKYYCPHCSHATSSRDMLTNHMLIHTKQVINFDCNLCGKKFLNAPDFKIHISEAHSK